MFSFQYLIKVVSYLIYGLFCVLILQITLQYIPINFDVAFLRIKQDEIQLFHYKVAFYTHVFTAIFSLLAGFTQFSVYFRRKYPIVHRYIGAVYIVAILIFAAPSGLIMSYYANGGFWSQLAFCLLSVGWFGTTYAAYASLKVKDYERHQRYMMRSFALTMSAITLRLWKYLIVFFWQPRPMDVYRIVAWLGWVLNLLIIELIIYKYFKK
ncbi:MAG: putative membrane protein [Aureispira sp.]|jgi:uncharacterized membrane protein